jgi:carbamoyl-phosphate synthase large subunit
MEIKPLTFLILGSGPIVIGQAAEFDYSGTQAVKALRSLGHKVILVNSNPATIMTDPDLADKTYIEPLTESVLEQIISQEKPDVLLPTVGGQTGLNLAFKLAQNGILDQFGVKLIGASLQAIQSAEDRFFFRETMMNAGIPVPKGGAVNDLSQAALLAQEIGFPLLVRSSYALGGTGASWVNAPDELNTAIVKAMNVSPVQQAWMEESLFGWKEYELEVMRDRLDNFVVVCSIENLDPMGVHTGDSITIAPAQTLTDREYQQLRDLAKRVIRAVGVETGGANVQFAVEPLTGRAMVIEMNPRVSRSSALASKATGFPIAKIAALVASGLTLDKITNDITGVTCAAFEPSLDYVVVKIPRWAYEKFPGVDPFLGPQMKSVGEVLSIGRTVPEAIHKAIQSLELGIDALDGSGPEKQPVQKVDLHDLHRPTADRLFHVFRAIQDDVALQVLAQITGYDLWFLAQLEIISKLQSTLLHCEYSKLIESDLMELLRTAKQCGFSDHHIGRLFGISANAVRQTRKRLGILPTYLRVDTCAAEFEAKTPYLYSTYETEDESLPSMNPKILILGSGPTGLVKASSLITVAVMLLLHYLRWVTKRLCLTVTLKQCPRIMILQIDYILNH